MIDDAAPSVLSHRCVYSIFHKLITGQYGGTAEDLKPLLQNFSCSWINWKLRSKQQARNRFSDTNHTHPVPACLHGNIVEPRWALLWSLWAKNKSITSETRMTPRYVNTPCDRVSSRISSRHFSNIPRTTAPPTYSKPIFGRFDLLAKEQSQSLELKKNSKIKYAVFLFSRLISSNKCLHDTELTACGGQHIQATSTLEWQAAGLHFTCSL